MVQDDYEAFVADIPTDGRRYAAIYHAVRNIPYGATGERDPVNVLKHRRGSCSGKHMLLRDLLRAEGYEAEVVTIVTHFNKAIPLLPVFPRKLIELIENDVICDFHHYVRVRIDAEWLSLDATWHDALGDYGFPVNTDWQGMGDTIIAAEALDVLPPVEDLATFKQDMINSLPADEREKRAQFFAELTKWMDVEVLPLESGEPK